MKKVFLTIAILTTPITVHAACTQAPDCATLGYTKTATDCPNGGVKCPFDSTKMFCSVSNETCELGSILFSDMTCSFSVKNGKTPIGVVGYIEGNKRMALSLDRANLTWGGSGYSIPGLNHSGFQDNDGKKNTSLIVAALGSNSNYAAGYCYNYKTAGTKQGDWYLPAVGEMNKALSGSHLSSAREKLGLASLPYYILTSTEIDEYSAYMVRYVAFNDIDKSEPSSVYCSISF